jgi:hypothetical protein
MTPSAHRRIFAGFQMGFLSVVLWPILPRPMAVIPGTLFAMATGLGFWRDWLVVSGTIHPAHPHLPMDPEGSLPTLCHPVAAALASLGGHLHDQHDESPPTTPATGSLV